MKERTTRTLTRKFSFVRLLPTALSLSDNRKTLAHPTITILSRRFRTEVVTRYFNILLASLFSENTHYFVREFSILNKNWKNMLPLVYSAKISKRKYLTLGRSLTLHRRVSFVSVTSNTTVNRHHARTET